MRFSIRELAVYERDVRLRMTLAKQHDRIVPVAFPYFGSEAPRDFVQRHFVGAQDAVSIGKGHAYFSSSRVSRG